MEQLKSFIVIFPLLIYLILIIPFLTGEVPPRFILALIIPVWLIIVFDHFQQWRTGHSCFVLFQLAIEILYFILLLSLILNHSAEFYDLPSYDYFCVLTPLLCSFGQIEEIRVRKMSSQKICFQVVILIGYVLLFFLSLSNIVF